MRAASLVLSVLVSGAALMSAPSAGGQQPRGQDRPNIVFIISDDHRWDALGAAGNPKIKTGGRLSPTRARPGRAQPGLVRLSARPARAKCIVRGRHAVL